MKSYDVSLTITIPLEDPDDMEECAKKINEVVKTGWFLDSGPEFAYDE